MSNRAVGAWRAAGSVFDSVSKRILCIRLKLHTGFVTLVAMYAPTNELRNEEESVEFYQALQDTVRQVPERDMLIVLGDFNARVGNDVEAWCSTLGKFGPAEQNENSRRLLDFCSLHDLMVTNTLFKHRPCHQET